MTVLLVVVTLVVLGLGPALAVDRRETPLALAGLAFLYGSGLVYVVLLVLAVAGIPWSLPLTMGTLIALSAAAHFWRRDEEPGAPAPPVVRASWIDLPTAALFVAYSVYALMRRPAHWDFWALWGLKARVFYEYGGIDWRFLKTDWNSFVHPDYPLLYPLNLSFTALAGGAWDDRWLGIESIAFGAALLLIIRARAAAELTPTLAAAITFAASAFALSPQIGLAEAPLIAYGTAGLLMLRRAILFEEAGSMRHAALLLGLAGVTKNEGMTLCLAAAGAMLAARVPLRRLVSLWPAAILVGTWTALRAARSLSTDVAGPGFLDRVASRLEAVPELGAAMMASLGRPMLWLLLLLGLAVASGRFVRREVFLLVAVGIQLAFVVLVYLGTPYDAAWHVASSWGRVSRQLGAPLLFAVMMALAQTFAPALRRD